MKMKHIVEAVAAASILAAGTAAAADISIYGRTDAGLKYTALKHGKDTLELKSGGRSTNRFGFNIVEDLGNGWKVKGYLENGFTIDDGAMGTANQLFNRRSILAVAGPYGEIGMGRAGTVQSTVAPYTMGLIKYDPFGTSYGNASIGSAFANTSRVNNGVHYVSPKFAGVNFGLSYSFGDSSDDTETTVDYEDRDHTFAAAVNYTGENLYLSGTFANVTYANNAATPRADAQIYGAGGWWRFMPETRLFFGAAYQSKWKSAASLSVKADSTTGITTDDVYNGFDGVSALIGMDWISGPHKVMADVQYFDGELNADSNIDYKRTILAAAYEYYFSKKVIGYFAVTHSMSSGAAEAIGSGDPDASEVFLGLNFNF